jgi:AbrB family looped-hinge helix DNA binding protein
VDTVKLSSRGQIVIPKDVRETAHLTEGMEFSVVYVDGQIRLTPVPVVEPTTHAQAAGCLFRPGRQPMSEAQQKAAIGRMLKARDDATRS